jgi:transmembrane sensor
MDDPLKSAGSGEERSAQAAGWILRRDRGLEEREHDEHLRWLAADPRNGEEEARLHDAWKRLDRLAEWGPEHSRGPNSDLLAAPAGRRFLVWPASLAAAALVVWAFVAIGPRARSPVVADAVPAGPVAEHYERRLLEDGSVVELNRGGLVTVRFTAGERRVELSRGEARFTVAKNPNRPFVVAVGGLGVRAVGTVFDVRLSDRSVEVLVTEGRVQVSREGAPGPPPQLVGAGQRGVFPSAPAFPPPRIAPVSAEEVASYLSWRPAPLSFRDAPLSEIVTAINGYNRVRLVVADDGTGAVQINLYGVDPTDVDGFVRQLGVLHIRSRTVGDTIVLSRAR